MYIVTNIPVKCHKKGTLAKNESVIIAGKITSFTYHENGLNVEGSYYKMNLEGEDPDTVLVKGDHQMNFAEGYPIDTVKGMEQYISNLSAETDWDLSWLKVYTVFLPEMLAALIDENPDLTINDLTIKNEIL